jgi:arginine dihydrolase
MSHVLNSFPSVAIEAPPLAESELARSSAPEVEAESSPAPQSPTRLERPAFLLAFPFCYSTGSPNNPWMTDLEPAQREPNLRRAMLQFLELHRFLASEALVYLLPTPRSCRLQDLVFTANLGVVLEHLADRDVVVISNFTSEPRRGETEVGCAFFRDMGYEVHVARAKFEGEAELKRLHDNVYVGGYGIRSERETYDWMEDAFEMEVIKVALRDPYLYHLDCSVFPLTDQNTLVCTELFEKDEVRRIEERTAIIDVSVDQAYAGICNSVRLSNTILNASHIHELKAGTQDYEHELGKNRRLEDIAAQLGFEVSYFNLSEYFKSGALLSCMVMHLNRHSYKFRLTL